MFWNSCVAFYQIIVQPKFFAKIVELTLLSVLWKKLNTPVPLNILSSVILFDNHIKLHGSFQNIELDQLGNGLPPDSTKPLHEPVSVRSTDLHIRTITISQEMYTSAINH